MGARNRAASSPTCSLSETQRDAQAFDPPWMRFCCTYFEEDEIFNSASSPGRWFDYSVEADSGLGVDRRALEDAFSCEVHRVDDTNILKPCPAEQISGEFISLMYVPMHTAGRYILGQCFIVSSAQRISMAREVPLQLVWGDDENKRAFEPSLASFYKVSPFVMRLDAPTKIYIMRHVGGGAVVVTAISFGPLGIFEADNVVLDSSGALLRTSVAMAQCMFCVELNTFCSCPPSFRARLFGSLCGGPGQDWRAFTQCALSAYHNHGRHLKYRVANWESQVHVPTPPSFGQLCRMYFRADMPLVKMRACFASRATARTRIDLDMRLATGEDHRLLLEDPASYPQPRKTRCIVCGQGPFHTYALFRKHSKEHKQ